MKIKILFVLLFAGYFCLGQQTQVAFQVNSGLFSFGGSSPSERSFLNLSDVQSISSYTNNPYGKKSGLSYGFGIQLQRVTGTDFIFGLQLAYESLSSKLTLDNAFGEMTWTIKEGKTILTSNFINLFPSIGHRLRFLKGVDTDLLIGLDFGAGLSSREHYSLTTSQGDEISGTSERDVPHIDTRPRFELVNYYRNFGVSIGYSYGLTNYQGGLVGAERESKSRYLRFGLTYRLK